MKSLLKQTAKVVLILLLVAGIVAKAVQTANRPKNVASMSPPSLDSSDPAKRVEAARQAAKKYGGKE